MHELFHVLLQELSEHYLVVCSVNNIYNEVENNFNLGPAPSYLINNHVMMTPYVFDQLYKPIVQFTSSSASTGKNSTNRLYSSLVLLLRPGKAYTALYLYRWPSTDKHVAALR